MLITVDAGNTETVFGVWQNSQLLDTLRVSTCRECTADDWRRLIGPWLAGQKNSRGVENFQAAIVSVVPIVEEPLERCFLALGSQKTMIGRRNMKFPFRFSPENFPTVGIDRLVNVAAGAKFYGDHLIVVDFGTAITFCLLKDREYLGGVISPGIQSAMESLTSRTASLPEISFGYQESILSTSTVEQMKSGLYFGWKGLVREILFELKCAARKDSKNVDFKVIATGGISSTLGFAHDFFDVVDPFLTLRGIHEFYSLNS